MNNNSIRKMELLAPAGNWEALLAALSAGADSVYLGGKAFSARQYASNFDLDRLKQAADLLHLHGKKIYTTVNTLVSDPEMPEAVSFLTELYNIGIDAVIVQDLGLIRLAQQYLPKLELHASTQMTIHNTAGALLLKKLGIKRIVLAREMTKREVQAIKEETGLEIEVFVHGALCVCYSGQCLMSSMIGGRSGNRGRCAQPCRLEYELYRNHELIPTKGPYLLSPKDLALTEIIPELYQAGVDSLKIEGRMKRPEYVYTVVKIYRRLLDRFLEQPEDYQVDPAEIKELSETFNRGFTTGYFGGNRNRGVISVTRPNNRGVLLGRIISSDQRTGMVKIRLETDLACGDLVEVWVSKGGRASVTVNLMFGPTGKELWSANPGDTVSFKVEGKAYPGDRVFKIASARLRKEAELARDPDNPALKIRCKAIVSGSKSMPLELIYEDQTGRQGAAKSAGLLQEARNRPLTMEVLLKHLGRLGNTPFNLVEVQNRLEGALMLPLSELNELRRQAIEDLTARLLAPYNRNKVEPKVDFSHNKSSTTKGTNPSLSVWVADLPGVAAAAKAGANLIYVGGDELTGFHWDRKALNEACEIAHAKGVKLVAGLPRINREGQKKEWIAYFKDVVETGNDGIMVSDLGGLQLALSESDRPLYLNYTLNFFNRWAFQLLADERLKQITLSPELSLSQISALAGSLSGDAPRLECLVQGPLELMVSEYCPIGSLTGKEDENCHGYCRKGRYYLKDRLKMDFPIVTDQFCRMHLLNSVDLCLYPDLERLVKVPQVFRLELKTLQAEAVTFFVNSYQQKLLGKGPNDAEKVIEEFRKITGRGITKGHYFRGVE
ncbi:MAG: U32 family peptidase [Firmicutes bacterium]|nr:U32 family peptidase [Bacillota bacterium]